MTCRCRRDSAPSLWTLRADVTPWALLGFPRWPDYTLTQCTYYAGRA